jgi:hypothetical protein
MNSEHRASGQRPRPPTRHTAARPGGGEQKASRWGVGILWVAAIGVAAVATGEAEAATLAEAAGAIGK